MPLILNGTTGVSGVDGSAGTPSYQGTDTNTGIFYPAADTIAFAEGGVEVARFDSSGNLGIGTSSPSATLDVRNTSNEQIRFGYTGTPNYCSLGRNSGTGNFNIFVNSAEPLVFGTNAAERMRITSSGNVGIASTTANTPLQVWGTTNSGYATSNSVTSGSQAISNSASLWNGSSLRLTANFGGAVNYTGRASELVFGADNGNFGAGGGFGQANLGAITAISEVGNATNLASSMIFYTTAGNNISERMRIDSAGRVTTPNQPAFFALFNEGGSAATPRTSEWSGGAYSGTAFNIGNNFSGGRFTAPVAGLYYFHFWVQEETFYGQWNNPVSIYWWKNGSANFSYGLDSPGIPSAYDEFWIAGSIIVQLAANDTFSASLYAPNSTVGGNPWVSTELNSGGFMGYLIG